MTYYGEASRMIQFKEKSKDNRNFSIGLLTYPILMAADILYVDADYVPVGIGQKQHVEIARDIANRFNNKYGDTFVLPNVYINENAIKIKDLKNSNKKMSKSEENPQGVISMFDSPELIKEKIMKATTDSENIIKYDKDKKIGISNLLNIASLISGKTINELEHEFSQKNYGEFKKYVADITANHISLIQKRYNQIIDSKELDEILNDGIKKSREIAKEKYEIMKSKMGLSRFPIKEKK